VDGELRVEGCRLEDLVSVRGILRACPEAASWTDEALREALAGEPGGFLVAWEGDEIAGFVVGRHVGDQGEVLNLAVAAPWRRRGVGRELVRGLLEEFRRVGAREVFLEVRASNAGAIRLYQGLGFRKIGGRIGYYRGPVEDAWILAIGVAVSEERFGIREG
jgi:ribosomal-protein-alanine acetyltransferase